MLPLIDVIFLLLTFFIYSIVVMVRAEVLPVQLTPLSAGAAPEPGQVAAITIAQDGKLHLNREPISDEQLNIWVDQAAASDTPPRVFVAMEAASAGQTDRGPVLLSVIETLRARGITDFAIVGEPVNAAGGGSTPGATLSGEPTSGRGTSGGER